MKKIFSIVIAGLLLLGTAGTALAAGQTSGQASGQTGGGTSGQGANQSGTTLQGKGNTEAYQAGKIQFERTRQQVRLNAGATSGVKTQLNDCSEELKALIQNKLQNGANISNEETARIKEAIQTFQKERQQIMLEHQGKIQEQVALLNQAKSRGDIEAANAAMNMIQTEQQARIAELNKVLQDFQKLLENIG
ncbi:hypothetical protein [Dehalobacter sp. TeCB1]|uniref:hypothetical protein n=1 Tax=Dehalobacter sp. TeCB1 TaxID=1843715 RepID=UPI00083B04ED|nr:hypothetical protein [Dehalobacter sp. TeCB1]OCZ49852.1 hypothetical protein A7D23_00440 [Dehalobacter sp. TeCB1]